MKNLITLYKLYLYALEERERYGEKYGDTEEIIEMYEKKLKIKEKRKKREKANNNNWHIVSDNNIIINYNFNNIIKSK